LVQENLRRRGISDFAIRWSANLAVPEKYMDISPTLDSFEQVLRTAWLMATILDDIGALAEAQDVIDCYASAKEVAETKQRLDCFVYPEVAAGVASVTMSRTAKEGLYAFVDVGAGTVDGSVFRFHRPSQGELSQATYAASVIKAGAAHIEMSASSKLADNARFWFRQMKENEGNTTDLSLDSSSMLGPPFEESLEEIQSEVEGELIQLFKAAHEKEVGESRWSDLQLVICGGGSTVAPYVTAAKVAFSLKGTGRGSHLTQVGLDAPPDFEMAPLSRQTFHRFAVAYGLSFHHVNLPEVVLAKEVTPMPLGSGYRIRGPIIDPTQDD
jgi:hypothetical protein